MRKLYHLKGMWSKRQGSYNLGGWTPHSEEAYWLRRPDRCRDQEDVGSNLAMSSPFLLGTGSGMLSLLRCVAAANFSAR